MFFFYAEIHSEKDEYIDSFEELFHLLVVERGF